MVIEENEDETIEKEYLTPAQWVEKAMEEFCFDIADGQSENGNYHLITLENFTDFIEQFAMRGEDSGKIGISPFYMKELLLDKFKAEGFPMCDDNQKLYYCYYIRLLNYKTTKAFSDYCGIRPPVCQNRAIKKVISVVMHSLFSAIASCVLNVENR